MCCDPPLQLALLHDELEARYEVVGLHCHGFAGRGRGLRGALRHLGVMVYTVIAITRKMSSSIMGLPGAAAVAAPVEECWYSSLSYS